MPQWRSGGPSRGSSTLLEQGPKSGYREERERKFPAAQVSAERATWTVIPPVGEGEKLVSAEWVPAFPSCVGHRQGAPLLPPPPMLSDLRGSGAGSGWKHSSQGLEPIQGTRVSLSPLQTP